MMRGPGFYCMDCMEAMRDYPDKHFSLAIVDPPYGINAPKMSMGSGASKDAGEYGTAVRLRKGRLNQGAGRLAGRILNQADCSWDAEPPGEEYFRELMRISQNQVIWGGNYFPLPPTRCVIVWDKLQPWENFSQVEIAWTSFDKPAALFRMANTGGGKIHPTQKPVELYAWILGRFAKEGDTIIDTHAGSGSCLVACQRAGYTWTGFEIDPGYFAAAEERIQREMNQVNIFRWKAYSQLGMWTRFSRQ